MDRSEAFRLLREAELMWRAGDDIFSQIQGRILRCKVCGEYEFFPQGATCGEIEAEWREADTVSRPNQPVPAWCPEHQHLAE